MPIVYCLFSYNISFDKQWSFQNYNMRPRCSDVLRHSPAFRVNITLKMHTIAHLISYIIHSRHIKYHATPKTDVNTRSERDLRETAKEKVHVNALCCAVYCHPECTLLQSSVLNLRLRTLELFTSLCNWNTSCSVTISNTFLWILQELQAFDTFQVRTY